MSWYRHLIQNITTPIVNLLGYFGGNFLRINAHETQRAALLNTDGSFDDTFNVGSSFNNVVFISGTQTNGKIIFGGAFTTFTGSTNNRLIRLNPDGTKDSTFNIGTGFNSSVNILAIQSGDSKILVGGAFTTFTGTTASTTSTNRYLIRLNSDGTKDSTFNIGTGFNGAILSLVIQTNGKILVGGSFTTFTGSTNNRLIRLNSNGTKDSTFNIGTGLGNTVRTLAIQNDEKILAGGDFTTFTGSTNNRLIRLNSNGTKDSTFNRGTGFNINVNLITIQTDGKILVGGQFTTFTGSTNNRFIRLNSDGTKDSTFNIGTGFGSTVNTSITLTDGKILVGGSFTTFTGSTKNGFVVLNTDGSLDVIFNIGLGFSNLASIQTIVKQISGKIMVCGNFTHYKGTLSNRLARLYTDGSLDETFNLGTGLNNQPNTLIRQTDGKIILGGAFTTFTGSTNNYLIRLNTNGTKDSTFNIGTGFGNGVTALAIQSGDSKILVGGQFTTFTGSTNNRLIRLNSNGTKDSTFNIGTGFGTSSVSTLAIQSGDGKILAGGNFVSYNSVLRYRLVRLNSDGTYDSTFDIGTGFGNNSVTKIRLQSDGKILVGGDYNTFTGSTNNNLIRLNPDGTKDSTFNIGSGFGTGSAVAELEIQTDGKIIVGGIFTGFTGSTNNRLIRLNSNGTKDSTFNIGTGFNGSITAMMIQTDGKIIVGGSFTQYNGTPQTRIARLNTNGSLDATFNITFTDYTVEIIAI